MIHGFLHSSTVCEVPVSQDSVLSVEGEQDKDCCHGIRMYPGHRTCSRDIPFLEYSPGTAVFPCGAIKMLVNYIYHCKKKLLVLTQSGYPGCILARAEMVMIMRAGFFVLDTNCQHERQLSSSLYYHNTPQNRNHLLALRAFLTTTLKCICNNSFTDVLRVVIVLWL